MQLGAQPATHLVCEASLGMFPWMPMVNSTGSKWATMRTCKGGTEGTQPGLSSPRSLFVVLDSLACTDGAISAAAQGWLVRALSLGDVARILEPMLLLLLQPKTQRTSIHCLKQESSAGEQLPGGRAAGTSSQRCRSALLT